MVQWLRLRAPNAGCLGSIPGQRTRSHMLQLKTLCATTKILCSKINKYLKKKKRKKLQGQNHQNPDYEKLHRVTNCNRYAPKKVRDGGKEVPIDNKIAKKNIN